MAGKDHDAEFVAFVLQVQERLTRTAYAMCGDWHRAEDVVQTVLVRLYSHWPRVNDRGDPFSYARRALVHALIDERRRPWRRESPIAEVAESVCAAREPSADADDDLFRALNDLPPRQRAVIVLRHLDGLSVAEVAHEMGISEGTVKSQASRALSALRKGLAKDSNEPR